MKQFVKKTILKTKYKEWIDHRILILISFVSSPITIFPIMDYYNIFTKNPISDFFIIIGIITTTIIIGYIISYILYLITETKVIYIEDKE